MRAPADPRRGDRLLAALAVACVGLQFPGTLVLSSAALLSWLMACAWLDPMVLRRMWMPRFWAITGVLALGSGVLLGRPDLDLGGLPLSTEGLAAGVLMLVRGGLILGMTTWAGRAMTGVRIQRFLGAAGLAPLGQAASVAIGLLPGMQGRLRRIGQVPAGAGRPTGRAARLHDLAVSAFCETVRVAEELAAKGALERPARIAAVVGEPGTGKTTLVMGVAQSLRDAGLRVGGVVQPALEASGIRTGYDLMDVATGETRPFARLATGPRPGSPRFAFDESGWAWAADRIRKGRQSVDVLVADEIGRQEAAGGGHLAVLLEPMADEKARWWLLSVRADGAGRVEQQVGGFDVRMDLARGGDVRAADADSLVARMLTADSRDETEDRA